MTSSICLGCYQALEIGIAADEYHKNCSKRLFGTEVPPKIEFGIERLDDLAKTAINHHLGVTGVQPKVSVALQKHNHDANHRFLIVGVWGNFILKPPTSRFPDLPVIEDATMHMATVAGIRTAHHGLIRLKSGELAYVTRRFDRLKDRGKYRKVQVEDFCQLSGLLTEQKYKTSMEKAGKIILKYSSNPGLDGVMFFDTTLFSFVTGNADMHLKNFSLMRTETNEIALSPAYDLISTKLLPINDPEEVALTVNGKKARLTREDFVALGLSLKMPEKAIENSFKRINRAVPEMKRIVGDSFMSTKLKDSYRTLMDSRVAVLNSR